MPITWIAITIRCQIMAGARSYKVVLERHFLIATLFSTDLPFRPSRPTMLIIMTGGRLRRLLTTEYRFTIDLVM